MDEEKQNSDKRSPKVSAKALIPVYVVPLLLGYGYFINEALRMGGAEGTKVLILSGISFLCGAAFFVYRCITKTSQGRSSYLDTSTTITTLAICLVSMIVLYACKDFMPKAFLEKEPIIDQR